MLLNKEASLSGAAIGGGIGGLAGAATGTDTKSRIKRALIGAGIGGAAGYGVGRLAQGAGKSGGGVDSTANKMIRMHEGENLFTVRDGRLVRARLDSEGKMVENYGEGGINVVPHNFSAEQLRPFEGRNISIPHTGTKDYPLDTFLRLANQRIK